MIFVIEEMPDKDVTLKRSQIKTLIDQARAGDEEEICSSAKAYIKKLDDDYTDEDDQDNQDNQEEEIKPKQKHKTKKYKQVNDEYVDGKYKFKFPKLPNLTKGIKHFFGWD